MVSSAAKPLDSQRRRNSDPVSWYLSTIGRIPLLTPAEEIELGNQVQAMMQLTEDGTRTFEDEELTSKQKRILRIGRRAKARMMKANLRLVVSVAKKYQGKGLELLDLIQEGSLGLERAVEKFDPTRGYKFSTYAFWWIRQSMTRAIACQSRTIRLPVHLSERLTTIRKVSLDLAHKLGAMPSRVEIAEAMERSRRRKLQDDNRRTDAVDGLVDDPVRRPAVCVGALVPAPASVFVGRHAA